MSTKTISVNPDFFNIGKKKKTKLSHSLRTNFNSLQKNILKNKMIDKINKFKKKNKKPIQTDDNFKNEYGNAVEFMENIIKKKTKKNRKRRKKNNIKNDVPNIKNDVPNIKNDVPDIKNDVPDIKNDVPDIKNEISDEIKKKTNNISNVIPINTQINTSNNPPNNHINQYKPNKQIKKDPPYGILKNGNKQLYSKYRKSLKKPISKENKKNVFVFTNEHNFGKQQDTKRPSTILRKNKLENLKETLLTKNIPKKNTTAKIKIKNKKIIKRFILGKNAKTRKVSILIKNKKTRRFVNDDCMFIKKKKLSQIKNVLVNNALIKVGTQAPEKLLRAMYVNRHLAGDIQNSGGKNAEEILMHNWTK
jgi:hypothetical protein